jgi:hypothetical protein
LGKRGISNVGALPLRSEPECLARVQLKERCGRILKNRILKSLNSISVSNGHQHGRRTLNLVGQVLDPIKALCQPIVQQIKLGGSMEIGALFAVHVQGGKHHRHGQTPQDVLGCAIFSSRRRAAFARACPVRMRQHKARLIASPWLSLSIVSACMRESSARFARCLATAISKFKSSTIPDRPSCQRSLPLENRHRSLSFRNATDLLDRALSLITALDMMEVDCDLADEADEEPSLGWTERGGQLRLSDTAPDLPPDHAPLEIGQIISAHTAAESHQRRC